MSDYRGTLDYRAVRLEGFHYNVNWLATMQSCEFIGGISNDELFLNKYDFYNISKRLIYLWSKANFNLIWKKKNFVTLSRFHVQPLSFYPCQYVAGEVCWYLCLCDHCMKLIPSNNPGSWIMSNDYLIGNNMQSCTLLWWTKSPRWLVILL